MCGVCEGFWSVRKARGLDSHSLNHKFWQLPCASTCRNCLTGLTPLRRRGFDQSLLNLLLIFIDIYWLVKCDQASLRKLHSQICKWFQLPDWSCIYWVTARRDWQPDQLGKDPHLAPASQGLMKQIDLDITTVGQCRTFCRPPSVLYIQKKERTW